MAKNFKNVRIRTQKLCFCGNNSNTVLTYSNDKIKKLDIFINSNSD